MIFLFACLFFVGLLFLGMLLSKSYDYDCLGYVLVTISLIFFFVCVLVFPINYTTAKDDIAQYKAVKQTIEYARINKMDSLEKATLINQIIDVNKKVASYKYWRKTIFRDTYPSEIDNLQLLK